LKYTQNYNLKKPEGTDLVNIDDLNYNADVIDSQLKTNADTITQHITDPAPHSGHALATLNPNIIRIKRSNPDAYGNYLQVDYYRKNGTLFARSVLSGGTPPQYTTRTITIYDADGTTVVDSYTFTITYNANGNPVDEW